MGVYMKTSPDVLAAATTIREQLQARVDQVGSQPGLNRDAQQCLMARAWVKAKADMDALQARVTTNTDARMRVLTGQVWGVDDIPGDKVSASISYRDATDRAQALTGQQDAMALLATAERSGDELLARAVACQADAAGWDDVAGAYFATRPSKAKQNAELHQLAPSFRNLSAVDMFMWVLPAPGGLDAQNPYRIQQIADNPAFATLR